VAIQPEADDQVPEAAIQIPADWLMALLDEETIRGSQRPDTRISLGPGGLSLSGVELLLERRWLREPYWLQITEAVTHGFVHQRSAVRLTLRGDRREHERRPPARGAR
jgi:hypothetical protein